MERMNERECEDKREREDENANGDAGLDALVSGTNVPQGTVVLAATPIGNTADASARLIALLERADIVAAEDTRRLYALANRLGVHVNGRVVAYHDHNERDKSDGLLDQVETGATVLVVSDAGMPTINDLCRELTKDFEQIRRGTIAQIRQSVIDEPPRGEMVLVVAGASEEEADAAVPASLSIEDLAVLSIDRAREDDLRIKDAISQVIAEHPLADGSLANRKQVYNTVLAMKE